MTAKSEKNSGKKGSKLPIIIIVLLLISGYILWPYLFGEKDFPFTAPENSNGTESVVTDGDLQGERENSENNVAPDGDSPVNGDSAEYSGEEELAFDAQLEDTVFRWIVSKMDNEDFTLLHISSMPETPENIALNQEEQIFVYRTEAGEDDSRSVLIGEPFSDAFFRLALVKENGEWVIAEEIDLW